MSKRNTLLTLSIFIVTGFIFASVNVKAHEASMVELWYEVGDEPESLDPTVPERLTVIITHDVTDEYEHYIESVNVTIWPHNSHEHPEDRPDHGMEDYKVLESGKTVVYDDNFTSQPSYSMWEIYYDNISSIYESMGGAPIDDDVIIRVTVTCHLTLESFYREIDLKHPYIHPDTEFITALAPSIVISVLLSLPLVGVIVADNIQKKKNKR